MMIFYILLLSIYPNEGSSLYVTINPRLFSQGITISEVGREAGRSFDSRVHKIGSLVGIRDDSRSLFLG